MAILFLSVRASSREAFFVIFLMTWQKDLNEAALVQ
jgi:hypothetical protein